MSVVTDERGHTSICFRSFTLSEKAYFRTNHGNKIIRVVSRTDNNFD